ncbi:zinc ribbon domain-containing protein [Micromonospora sp. NPDC048830]|uniref:zinc ribbon domain-containing protein n=1 Tax=Micromonospora sp. NPDC048830 TaxID=3364257 RepID=UPI00372235BC
MKLLTLRDHGRFCGNTHRNNRKSQAMFRCASCGYQANADVNAAINVRDTAEAAPPPTGRAVRDRNQPASCRPPTQRRRRTALEAGSPASRRERMSIRRNSEYHHDQCAGRPRLPLQF